MIFISTVLLVVMTVRCGRWLAARWRGSVTGSSHEWMLEELPADYGMNPQRPWERRPRRGARLAS
jgi:hypothetical protein